MPILASPVTELITFWGPKKIEFPPLKDGGSGFHGATAGPAIEKLVPPSIQKKGKDVKRAVYVRVVGWKDLKSEKRVEGEERDECRFFFHGDDEAGVESEVHRVRFRDF